MALPLKHSKHRTWKQITFLVIVVMARDTVEVIVKVVVEATVPAVVVALVALVASVEVTIV